jgi:hypothetical protein
MMQKVTRFQHRLIALDMADQKAIQGNESVGDFLEKPRIQIICHPPHAAAPLASTIALLHAGK